jgi:hypothetical protein
VRSRRGQPPLDNLRPWDVYKGMCRFSPSTASTQDVDLTFSELSHVCCAVACLIQCFISYCRMTRPQRSELEVLRCGTGIGHPAPAASYRRSNAGRTAHASARPTKRTFYRERRGGDLIVGGGQVVSDLCGHECRWVVSELRSEVVKCLAAYRVG